MIKLRTQIQKKGDVSIHINKDQFVLNLILLHRKPRTKIIPISFKWNLDPIMTDELIYV